MAMTLAELEDLVNRIECRLTTVEEVMNRVQTAMTNLASQEQLRRINLIRQTEIDDLKGLITDLQNELALVKNEVFS